jgi:hypothetical protein
MARVTAVRVMRLIRPASLYKGHGYFVKPSEDFPIADSGDRLEGIWPSAAGDRGRKC